MSKKEILFSHEGSRGKTNIRPEDADALSFALISAAGVVAGLATLVGGAFMVSRMIGSSFNSLKN